MSVYHRQVATALRLIKQYGQLVTWRVLTDGAPAAPGEDWKPGPQVITNYDDVSIAFFPRDRVNEVLYRHLTGTEIPVGNEYGLMGAQTFLPSLKDVVIRDGKPLRIVKIDTLAPNGEVILHTIDFAT